MASSRRSQTFDVFVGNLPSDANEKNVGKLFTPFGEIGGIIVKESTKAKGPNKHFAFVKFLCEPDADKACAELDKKNLNGVEIVVKKADKDYKDKKRGQFDGGKKNQIPRTPDTELSDSVGGPVSDNVESAEIPKVGKALEQVKSQTRETVMITHVESPITVWIQVVNDENTKKIFNITEQLATLCPAASPITTAPEMGKTYASLYAEDNMWYRCQMKQALGTDKYKIQYIDYGNTEEVTMNNLVDIPASVGNLKGLANKLMLHNIRAKDLLDKQGIQFLHQLTNNQMAVLEKTRALADGTGFYGQLFVNEQSVGDAMVSAGFCQARAGLLGKTGPPNRQTDGMMDNSIQPLMGQPLRPAGDKNAVQRDRNSMSPMTNNFGLGGNVDSNREKELQSELNRKKKELERARNDKDAATLQVEYMRTKVKTLQEEFAASAAKLQEDTMSKRINTLTALAKAVRRLRDQFPTDNKSCLLEEAIDVCTSKDRVDNSKCTTLQAVGSALSSYKAAQDEISKCKQQSEIDDIVKSRDESRKQLHQSLTACLDELALLPLEERTKSVQDLQMRLTSTYGEYLKVQIHDCPSIENVAAGFKVWKSKKDTEFTDVRTVTNFSEEALQTALAQVKERISIDSGISGDKPEVDIDELMKTYAHALQREISVTDLAHSKDANLVSNVVSSVIHELQSESATLENFRVLMREFKTRQETIAPWLDEKPTFTDLQENRKLLRSLRSKLRHKMADKLDVEEGGSEGELESIKGEEEKIRSELQAALVKSDSLLHEVAALADTNFPELIVQYPDLAIDQFLLYKGLVKGNREIDHYSLTPGFRSGLHLSTFNGNPVLIQEYVLDQTTKEDFVKRVANYPGEVFKVQAIFFSKNERQAFLESPWAGGELIEKVIKDSKPTPHKLQQICVQLTQEVIQLHKHGIVHGEINTQSILLRENSQVVLVNPDFSKTLQERLNKKVSTENGLVFQCPDVQYATADVIGAAADIYNLVLFMFWLHCPSVKQGTTSSGSPEAGVQNLDTSLQALFDGVLNGKTANRITAEQILQLDYFRKTFPDNFDPPPVFQPAVIAPKTPSPPSQNPVIKSMDEPMEIGVFRAEDFSAPPLESNLVPTVTESDDSWTTKSSSSGSRVESPSDETDNTANKTDNTETITDNIKSLAVADQQDTNAITTNAGSLQDNQAEKSDTKIPEVLPNNGDVCPQMTPSGDNVPNQAPVVGDVFSQASNSEFLKEERKSLGEILSETATCDSAESLPVVGEGNLKSLLSGCKNFLTSSMPDVSSTNGEVTK